MSQSNPFIFDSWEWHAFEAAMWISNNGCPTDYFTVDEYEWENMWERVFDYVRRTGDDHRHPIAVLGWAGLVAACTSKVEHASEIEGVKFIADKQRDYGNLNILKFGVEGIRVRSSDKVERIKNLKAKGSDGVAEPLGDAYFDLWGYMVVLRMLNQGVFTKPLSENMADEAIVSVETPTMDLRRIKLVYVGQEPENLYAIYDVTEYDGPLVGRPE